MPESTTKKLKIFFFSIEATGHQSACIGLAQALLQRGHEVHFLLTEAFRGKMAPYGLKELIFTNPNPPQQEGEEPKEFDVNPVKATADFLLTSGLLGASDSLTKMKVMCNEEFVKNVYDKAVLYAPQLEALIQEQKPDVFIQDHFLLLPTVLSARVPYVQIWSGNPLFLYNVPDRVPPSCSGYSAKSDSSTWTAFNEVFQHTYLPIIRKFQRLLYETLNFDPSILAECEQEGVHNFPYSPYLNIYGYPEELDYQDLFKLPETFAPIDSFCRDSAEEFQLPEGFVEPGEKLIYFSLGSMGCIDVELMNRLLGMLSKTPYKYIVSKGPRAEEINLPANCWGKGHLPQTAILPQVDLVMIHGGNNSFTEAFTAGKPMIVMPLFADQFDNATRIQDKGLGLSVLPYLVTESELHETIEKMLKDTELALRMDSIGKRIRSVNSKKPQACEQIEGLVK